MTQVTLRKVGTNYVVTIPAKLIIKLHLKQGQKLYVAQEGGRLVLTPATAELDATLKAHEKIMQRYRQAFQQLM